MADLSEIQAAQAVKIVGSDSAGVEGTPVLSTASGGLRVVDELVAFNENGQNYTATTNNITMGTAETPFYYFYNPAGSGKNIRIYNISLAAYGANAASTFRLYKSPTITANGTALTVTNNNIGSAISNVATAFSQPSASSNGTLIRVYSIAAAVSTQNFNIPGYIILQPNQALLMTSNSGTNNANTVCRFDWTEA